VSLQCWWRATLLRRRFLSMRRAAIIIQRTARRNLDFKHQAATRIQAYARVWLARRTVAKMNTAALRIQVKKTSLENVILVLASLSGILRL
jgi:hypothetical protein